MLRFGASYIRDLTGILVLWLSPLFEIQRSGIVMVFHRPNLIMPQDRCVKITKRSRLRVHQISTWWSPFLSIFKKKINIYIIYFYVITKQSQAPSQYQKRRLFVRTRKVSKPRDWYFKLSYRFEIWQAHRQHCCRSACQISERSDNSKYKSRGFETLRDLTERRLFWYWDGALGYCSILQFAGLDGLTYWGLDKMADIFITVTS